MNITNIKHFTPFLHYLCIRWKLYLYSTDTDSVGNALILSGTIQFKEKSNLCNPKASLVCLSKRVKEKPDVDWTVTFEIHSYPLCSPFIGAYLLITSLCFAVALLGKEAVARERGEPAFFQCRKVYLRHCPEAILTCQRRGKWLLTSLYFDVIPRTQEPAKWMFAFSLLWTHFLYA